MKAVLEPWASQFSGGEDWCLQQDWAPAHGVKTTLRVCEGRFPHFWDEDVWPSNSPGLNLMDYSAWSVLKETVEAAKPIDALRAWDELPVSLLARIVAQFKKGLKACVKTSGDYYEDLL